MRIVNHNDAQQPQPRHDGEPMARLVTLCGAVVALLGLAVMVGWHAGVAALVQVSPTFVPMQYNTALCFVLCGGGLAAMSLGRPRVTRVVAAIAALVGALTLVQYVAGVDLGIDQLIIEHWTTVETSHPGRMAPNTALCFVLAAVALIWNSVSLDRGAWRLWPSLIASVVLALGLTAAIGYVTGIEAAYGWHRWTRMAVHTAVGFIVLGTGLEMLAWRLTRGLGSMPTRWMTAPVAVVCLAVTLTLWQGALVQQRQFYKQAVEAELARARVDIDTRFASQTRAVTRMARRMAMMEGVGEAEWRVDAQAYISDMPALLSIDWVGPDLVVRWSQSAAGVPDDTGHNLGDDPTRRAAFDAARRTGEPALTDPIDLTQGRRGFRLVVPIGADRSEGYVSAVYRYSELLEELLAPTREDGFETGVRLGDEWLLAAPADIVDARPTDDRAALESPILLMGKEATLRVRPGEPIHVRLSSSLPGVLLISGLVATALLPATLGLLVATRRRELVGISLNESLHEEISQRKAMEFELRESQRALETHAAELTRANERLEQMKRFFELSVDMMCIAGEGRFEELNPAFVETLGYQPDELEGRPFIDFVHPEDREATLTEAARLMADEDHTAINFENRYRTKDGEYRWLAWRSRQVDGKIFAVARDVTEQKRLDAQIRQLNADLQRYVTELQRSNEELDRFAYVASHDLKAPLRAIDNLSRWIAEDMGEDMPEATREQMTLMRERVARMERLLDDLLAYSRVGRFEDVGEADVGTMLDEIVKLLAPPESFTIDIADGMPKLDNTPRTPLETVFRNLINNAIKHHDREDGRVAVSVEDAGDRYAFTVSDDGPGIDPKFHDKAFAMFQTLRPRDDVEGSGMGLALVRKIVEYYGGAITLDSDVGRGATFRFTWPKQWKANDDE